MKHERVFVTGLGSVNGLANNAADFWRKMIAGESAIRHWPGGIAKGLPVSYVAEVDWQRFREQFADYSALAHNMEKRTAFGLVAAAEALRDAGLTDAARRSRSAGVIVGSGVPERDEAFDIAAYTRSGLDWNRWWDNRIQADKNSGTWLSNDHLGVTLAREFSITGPVLNISTACAGAAQAIGIASRMIRRGETSVMLAGGADSVLNTVTMIGLYLLGAPSTKETLAERLCRPFDRDRSGLVAGEGGAMVVLESESHARRRGARVYAEVLGYGASMDAYKITAPHPEGEGQARAMSRALEQAGLPPASIDYINAHGTSTPLNDLAETLAIKSVFAEAQHYRQLAVSSIKAHIGHLIAAAGAAEFVATVLAVEQQTAPPTLNLDNPDDGCDLDYVPLQARPMRIRHAMTNSFGFGGLNTSLVVAPYAAS